MLVIHIGIYIIYAETIFINRLIVLFNKENIPKGTGVDGQEIKASLGKNIKKLRTQRHYSQEELAEKADISIIYLSSIERGKKFPKPAILGQIVEGLEVELYELFKADHVPKAASVVTTEDNQKLINRISKDITKKVMQAMETGFKKYMT